MFELFFFTKWNKFAEPKPFIRCLFILSELFELILYCFLSFFGEDWQDFFFKLDSIKCGLLSLFMILFFYFKLRQLQCFLNGLFMIFGLKKELFCFNIFGKFLNGCILIELKVFAC